MKRIVLGVVLGVILCLFFQAKGPDMMKAVGLNRASLSKAERSVKRLVQDSEEAAGEVADRVEEGVEKAGKRVKKMMDD